MKKLVLLICITFIVIITFYKNYIYPTLRVASGYTAKYVCSSTFLSNITEDNIKNALDLFLVKNVKYEIDKDQKLVKTSLFGIAKREAVYYNNGISCGCLLKYADTIPANITERKIVENNDANSSELHWPQGNKLHDSIPNFINKKRLDSILQNSLAANTKTLAITVAYNNFLVGEAYNSGVDAETRLLGWSMTKSIGNALFGILNKTKKIDIYKETGISEWQGDGRKSITTNNLLQMSGGLQWEENYFRLSDVTKMLFLNQDFPAYEIQPNLENKPNEKWLYSSGSSNILSDILRMNFSNHENYLRFPYDSLFQQINMKSALIELENKGNYALSSYAWATARDWTRFGLLYLYKGNWFGKEIFTPQWATYSTTPSTTSNGVYGAQFWLNYSGEKVPSINRDAFYEDGFGGQRILIIPSRNLVITVLSGNQSNFNFDEFYSHIVSCFDNE
jgi:CubicO group peptidase (beta-lactamase class C family)